MENLTTLLEKGRKVRWGSEQGRVIHDAGLEHVWVERGDGQDCFAHRDLIEPQGTVRVGGLVTAKWRAHPNEKGVVHAFFDRSDGRRMAVVEWAGYHTETALVADLDAA